MLGRDVCSAAAAAHEVIALTREDLDITDAEAVDTALSAGRPDAVINCAAWTDVDGAEWRAEEAWAVNGRGAQNVATAAGAIGAWTVHISTDYVFDGRKREPYLEADPVAPLSAYGRSKLAGERAVAQAAPGIHTIVRTSWLFGAGGPCFPKTILRLAQERAELTVVDDQLGCPTFTGHLAEALVALAADQALVGVLHVAADGECTWHELARSLIDAAAIRCEIHRGKAVELGRPAPRPAYGVLRSERPSAPRLPHWRAGMAAFMAAGVPSP
jgi:dTDP-4-dehydrorhamnose reductase